MSKTKIRNREEFAAKSDVSLPTVLKSFNDPLSLRSSPRKRIEAALERYDFRPSLYAVNQNRRVTKDIGIVVPNVAGPFLFAELTRNIERRSIDATRQPHGGSSEQDPTDWTKAPEAAYASFQSLDPTQ